MARLFDDGFELGSPLPAQVVYSTATTVSTVTSSPVPRTGAYCEKYISSTANSGLCEGYHRIDLTSLSEVWVRIAFYASLASVESEATILRFINSSNEVLAALTVSYGNTLNAYRGSAIGVSAVMAGPISVPAGTWNSLKVHYLPHDTTGNMHIYLNGTSVANFTGDTLDVANVTLRYIDWGFIRNVAAASSVSYIAIDDVAINDSSGTAQNAFMGDGGIVLLRPNGNGAYSQLVGSDTNSIDNYLLLDELPPSSIDYVGSTITNNKDTYTMTDVPVIYGTVVLVRPIWNAALAAAGTGALLPTYRAGGVDYDDTIDRSLTTSYTVYAGEVRYTHPSGSAWTVENLNALEAGIKIR